MNAYEILQETLNDQKQLLSYFDREIEHAEGKRAYDIAVQDYAELTERIKRTEEAIATLNKLHSVCRVKDGKFTINTSEAFFYELFPARQPLGIAKSES